MVTESSKLIPVFGALGDPTREAIVELLAGGPQPVHRLASGFPITRPAISRHLRLLKEAGIVGERRRGRERIYFLRLGALAPVAEWAMVMKEAGESGAGEPEAGGADAAEGDAGGLEAGGVRAGEVKVGGAGAARLPKGEGGSAAPRRQKAAPRRSRRAAAAARGGIRPVEGDGVSTGVSGQADDDWKAW